MTGFDPNAGRGWARRAWLGLVLVWLAFGSGVQAVELTQGPKVVNSGPTQVAIEWGTDVACGSRVQYGTSPRAMTRREDGEVGAEHRVVLTGLVPGTTYHFSVGTARYPLATNSFTFQAAGGGVGEGVSPPSGRTNSPAAGRPPVSVPESPRPPPARVTWGNLGSLQDHFVRHGADFSARDPEDYARLAWEFRERARREGWSAKQDEDGVVRVYDARSGGFAAYNRNGTTKTFFKPQSRTYFERQPGERIDLKKWKP